MKKIFAIVIALTMVLTMVASVASAGVVQNTFDYRTIRCQANMETGLNSYDSAGKTLNAGRLYVRHYLHGEFGGVYTNYFKAGLIKRDAPNLVGGNWMAPDTANFVRSTTIKIGSSQTWHAYGRGNTDYGLNTIEISGYSNIDG